jgi:hypothetical protein
MKKKKSVAELVVANKNCFSVNEERKRKLIIVNKELVFSRYRKENEQQN